MYKVFISDNPLIITSEKSALDINRCEFSEVLMSFDFVNAETFKGIEIVGDEQKIWDAFRNKYKEIIAAGGVVLNGNDQVLFIFRNGKWDLPKGKAEKGESIEETAIREVEEECGIEGLSIVKPLSNTYHTYEMKGTNILKTTVWYLMKTNYAEKLIPQTEEGITKVEWIPRSAWDKVRANTYPSVNELLDLL